MPGVVRIRKITRVREGGRMPHKLLMVLAAVGLMGAGQMPSLAPADVRPVGNIAVSAETYSGRAALRADDLGRAGGKACAASGT